MRKGVQRVLCVASMIAAALPSWQAAAGPVDAWRVGTGDSTAPIENASPPSPEDLGTVRRLLDQGKYAEAEQAARGLLAAAEAATGTESLRAAEVIDLLVEALLFGGKARGGESMALAERGLRVREASLGPEHPDVARSLNSLARINGQRGDFRAARPLYERALAIREKALGPRHPDVAQSLNNLALLLSTLGEYPASRRLLERAVAIFESVLGAEHPHVAVSLHNLSLVLLSMGDFVESRALTDRAMAIWEKAWGPDHPDLALSLENAGMLAVKMGDSAGARPLLERALAISEKQLGPGHPEVALKLNALAVTLTRLGDRDRAMSLAVRAREILEKTRSPDHPDVAECLFTIAELHMLAGNLDDAGQLYARSLHIGEATLGPDHPLVARSMNGVARVRWRAGDVAALDTALLAEAIGRRKFQEIARSLPEGEALRFALTRASGLSLALSVLAQPSPDALAADAAWRTWDELVRSRAMVLDEMSARHRTLSEVGGEDLSRLIAALDRARFRVARLVLDGPGRGEAETYRDLIRQAQEEKETAERSLAERSAEFRRELGRRRVGLGEVAAALPPKNALVAYVRYDRSIPAGTKRDAPAAAFDPEPHYAAFVLGPNAPQPTFVPLGVAASIDRLVLAWQQEASAAPGVLAPAAARRAEARCRGAGEDLRRVVWDPLSRSIAGARQVFVVPDGALHLVNLAALPQSSGRYLIESGPLLHYLSAERDLVPEDLPATRGRGLLAMGGPDYDAPEALADRPSGKSSSADAVAKGGSQVRPVYRSARPLCGEPALHGFRALPGALFEVQEIASLWRSKEASTDSGQALVLTGQNAGEAAFKNEAGRRRLLHLATHAFFLHGECDPVGPSSPESGGTPARPAQGPVAVTSPLILSGLALAGANRGSAADGEAAEDGILTADEISALDLSAVEWAVLSACDTGLGSVQDGEGVLGLRRAFQTAGAGTVVMSLWGVDDAATRDWMKRLYRARLSGSSTAESMRRAGLDVLGTRRKEGKSSHPFFWGAFVAAGDWR